MEGAELSGQTLECLSNSKVQEIARTLVSEVLWAWLNDHPIEEDRIIKKGLHAADYNRKHSR